MNDAFELTDVEIPIDGVLDANAIAKAEAEFTSLLDYLNNPSQELTDFLATPEGQSYSTDMDMYIQTLEEILNELSNIGALEMSNPVDVELALMKILDIMQLNDTFFAPLYRTFQTRNAIAAAPRPRLTTADISTAQNIITQNGTRSLVTINASDSNDYTTININYINRLAALDTLVTTTVDDLLIREEDGRRKSSLPQNTPVILTGERKIMTITNNGTLCIFKSKIVKERYLGM
jgi:ethanolamine utilization protein EutP (predicted NTPase)